MFFGGKMMKKSIAVITAMVVLFITLSCFTVSAAGNICTASPAEWTGFYTKGLTVSGTTLICTRTQRSSWCTPAFDIFRYINDSLATENAKRVKYEYVLDAAFFSDSTDKNGSVNSLLRCNNKIGLCDAANGNKTEYRGSLGKYIDIEYGIKYTFTNTFCISQSDLLNAKQWLFCFDGIDESVSRIEIYSFEINRVDAVGDDEIAIGAVSIRKNGEAQPIPTQTVKPIDKKIETTPGRIIMPARTAKPLEKGKNLIEEMSSDFNDAVRVSDTAWEAFSCGMLQLAESYDGKCIKTDSLPNSWSSPSIDLYPYITSAGTYSVGFAYKVVLGGTQGDAKFAIRGKAANSFLQQHGSNVFSEFGSNRIISDTWQYHCFSFDVTEDDINAPNEFNFCFSSIPENVKSVEIDDFVLVFGDKNSLPAQPELPVNESADIQQRPSANAGGRKTFFDPRIKSASVITLVITAVTVGVVIAFKLIKYKKENER